MTTQEKEEDQKKQKQIEQVKKILTTASRAAASRTTEHTPYVKRDTTTIQSASKSTTDLVISAPSVAGTSSRVSLGSKRNFTNGVSCVSKRPRVMGNARGRQGRGRNTLRLQYSGSAGDAEGRGSSRANLEHLLAVAEVSTEEFFLIYISRETPLTVGVPLTRCSNVVFRIASLFQRAVEREFFSLGDLTE